jgi:hypothetical protein
MNRGLTKLRIELEDSGRWGTPSVRVPILTDAEQKRVDELHAEFKYKRSQEYSDLLRAMQIEKLEALRKNKETA